MVGAGWSVASSCRPQALELGCAALQDLVGKGREVEGFVSVEAALAACEGEERVGQLLLLLAEGEQPFGGGAEGVDGRVGVGEVRFEQRPLQRKWGAQLVGGVGDEAALGGERGLEPVEQVVEGAGELAQLVVGAAEGEPLMQAAGGDRAGAFVQEPQRPQDASGGQPAEADRGGGHHGERDPRVEEQLVQLLVVLASDQARGHSDDVRGARLKFLPRRALGPGPDEVVTDEDVGDREQAGAGGDKQARVDDREPQPHGAARQPGPRVGQQAVAESRHVCSMR